jgi:hypothetical protein
MPETSEDYKKLIKYIQSFSYWAKPLKSVWLIKTPKSTSDIRDELKSQTDANDGLLVINVTSKGWATNGINKEVTEWMKNNL